MMSTVLEGMGISLMKPNSEFWLTTEERVYLQIPLHWVGVVIIARLYLDRKNTIFFVFYN